MRIRTRRLPAGYNELEYIESTGIQWINTGLAVNYNYKVALTMYQENNVETWQQFFGIRGYGAQIGLYAKRIDDNVVCYDYVNRSSYIPRDRVFPLKKIHNVLVDKNKVYVDGSLIFQVAEQSFGYTTNSLFLFAYNSQDGSRDGYCGRLYNCSMWDNGTLARKFIPAERISDNKPGLYDLVNSVFYTNIGTGEFIKGPYASCSYQAPLTLLPSEYQEVEYIEGSGTQFIKTTYIPTAATSLDLQFMVTSTQTSEGGWEQITGEKTAYHSTSSFQVAFCTLSGSTNNHLGLDYGQANDLAATTLPGIDRNVIINVKMTPDNWIVNDTHVIPHNYSLSGTGIPLWIFDCNKANTNERPFIGRIYFYKIYENKNLMHNFIPCYRKNDNVIGLYDTVGKQFYVNQGTGTFTKGNNVADNVETIISGNYGYIDFTYTASTWSKHYPVFDESINLKYI